MICDKHRAERVGADEGAAFAANKLKTFFFKTLPQLVLDRH